MSSKRSPSGICAGALPLVVLFAVLSGCPNVITGLQDLQLNDKIAPVVSITSPAAQASYSPTVQVAGTVMDKANETGAAGQVSAVSYEVVGTPVGASVSLAAGGGFSFAFSTSGLMGTLTVRVGAEDWNGNKSTAELVLVAPKEIVSLGFLAANNPSLPMDAAGVIEGTGISVIVPFETDVTALKASFQQTGVSVKVGTTVQASGVTPNNFSAPVAYTVVANDATTKQYTVTVSKASPQSKEITSFAFLVADNPGLSMDATGVIVVTDITVEVGILTPLGSLVASFTSTGAGVTVGGVTQVSGVTVNDFTSPMVYRVRALDGTTKDYTVTLHFIELKLLASDAQAADSFGSSVGTSGDYTIVGAALEDAGGTDAGAAYVFHRTGTSTWDAGVKLPASDAQADDRFGYSVAISGDYAIVGAYGEDSGGSNAGAAYVFHRTGINTWDAGVKLTASDAQADDYFGWSVAISGDYAIVGAFLEDAGGSAAGAAYVFHRTDTNTWDGGVKLLASDAQTSDRFGCSVATSGDYAVVGADWEDAGGSEAGAAYAFRRTGTSTWDTGVKLLASDAQDADSFGSSVAMSGDYAIVGAAVEDAGGADAGAAYVFHRTGTNTWDTGMKLLASDAQADDNFGCSVSISDDNAIVGARSEDTGGSNAGAAYLFLRSGTNTWDTGAKLLASDAQANDWFGYSIVISSDCAIVGAECEDDRGTDAGAAYLYIR